MTSINLDSIQFYQPPIKANLAGKQPSMALVDNAPVIYGDGHISRVPRSNGGCGGALNNYDLIEVLDSTGSSSKDPLDLLSYKHALDLKFSLALLLHYITAISAIALALSPQIKFSNQTLPTVLLTIAME